MDTDTGTFRVLQEQVWIVSSFLLKFRPDWRSYHDSRNLGRTIGTQYE